MNKIIPILALLLLVGCTTEKEIESYSLPGEIEIIDYIGIGTHVPNHLMVFSNGSGDTIGFIDIIDNQMIFEGDADASAKVFFDALKFSIDDYCQRPFEEFDTDPTIL